MAYSMKDVETLTAMVMEEQGDNAISHVSNFIDQLRVEKDMLSASLWTRVLALLYHHAQQVPSTPIWPARNGRTSEQEQPVQPGQPTLTSSVIILY